MGWSADAVRTQVGPADLWMDTKDQFDRIGEVELKVEVAGLAVSMFADRTQRVSYLARDPTDRAEKVPVQFQEPLTRSAQAGGDELVRVNSPAISQSKRPDPGDL